MAEDLEATATLTKGAGEREGEGEARGAMLYVVLRAGRPSAGASRHRLTGEARLGRGSRFRAEREGDRLSLKLADAAVSSAHAALVPSGAGHRLVDLGSKNGTELDGARVTEAPLHDGALIGVGGSLLLYRNPTRLGEDRDSVEGAEPRGLLTLVPSLEASWDKLRRVAASTQTVVLGGESGTGKEVTARAIHALSGRRGRLVAVNCGALPDSLIESQLFGHERGAFSGADEARDGLVQAADGGTLFLDEIGELSPKAQVTLLRVLQEREVRRVGATGAKPVDLRLVVASLRSLPRLVQQGVFREDLYARIAGLEVELPPLRRRREDLGWLLGELAKRRAPERELRVEMSAALYLFRHGWPRNIRELDSTLATALALMDDDQLRREHLPASASEGEEREGEEREGEEREGEEREARRSAAPAAWSPSDQALHAELVTALEAHGGNMTRVAEQLGKKRQQIQKWCRRLGIDPTRFR